ncbi:HNH endonuclease signature motif containing protein [Paenibacillus cisolokensis]|uniref:HNH endonuclease signature motif containing protein n=1 Tax=Paenibacillus cisolokensis TaxID=1658519 RepID=UPI003556E58E
MFGRLGPLAPGYVDGRNSIAGDIWRKIALVHKPPICEVCGDIPEDSRRLHVHHKDKDRSNNDLSNLQVVCVSCHNNILHKRERDRFGRYTGKEVV